MFNPQRFTPSAYYFKDDTRRLQTEVRRMLLQYVLQVLEDDFQFKLTNERLQDSVAKAVLSCDQRFRHVKWVPVFVACSQPLHFYCVLIVNVF